MSFDRTSDPLRAKVGLSKLRTPLALGIAILIIVIVGVCGYTVWKSISTPGVEVVQNDSESNEDESGVSEATSQIYVHVSGAVTSPGLYQLELGSRVYDAIQAAGGFSDEAVEQSVNLARELTDGEQIMVSSASDVSASASDTSSASTQTSTGKVNINLASAEELMTLDGVGEATAAKIIAYREENGSFKTIEEIKEVSGIGDKKYAAIKDVITV